MRHLTRTLTATAVATAALAWAPGAVGADERVDAEIAFTSQEPGSSTGLRLVAEYKNPSDPNAKPPPLAGAHFDLPPGTRIDNDAVPKCRATDGEIYARGRGACPAETLIGTGRLVALTGAGPPADPFDGEALFFNGDGEIIEIVLVRGTDRAAGFDRIKISGSRLTAHPPSLPGGPPDGRTAIKRVELDAPARLPGARPYLTTPATCPADRLWRASASFSFDDGGSTTVQDTLPCVAAPVAAHGLTLRVTPSRVRGERRSTFRIRVGSRTPGCAARATVRLGRARATTDASGRAVLRKHLSSVRSVTVRASKRGCGRATARVSVLPAGRR